MYQKPRDERDGLEENQKELEKQMQTPETINVEQKARETVRQFIDTAFTNREMLVRLIERIELTADRRIII